jgi:hypothetical protein
MNHLVHSAAILVSLALAFPVAAQEIQDEEVVLELPAARQGYWIGGGVAGVTNVNNRTDGPDTGVLIGYDFHLRMGELITESVGIGLQLGGGPLENDLYEGGFGGVALTAHWAPLGHASVHGGVGAGGIGARATSQGRELTGTGGGYYVLGLAYDLFPFWDEGSGGFSLSPTLQAQYLPGPLFEAWIVTFCVDVMWWTGLDKHKLDLDVDMAY